MMTMLVGLAIQWLPIVSALISTFIVCADSATVGTNTLSSSFRLIVWSISSSPGPSPAQGPVPGPGPSPSPTPVRTSSPNPNPKVQPPIFMTPNVLPGLPNSSDKHRLQKTIGLVLISFAGTLQVFVIAYLFYKRRQILKYVRPPENGPPQRSQ